MKMPYTWEDRCVYLACVLGECFCRLRDDVDDMKPHWGFCEGCPYYKSIKENHKI